MRKFKVYRRDWITLPPTRPGAEPTFQADMRPIMTINAKTPEAALRIAKQKNVVAPIIGAVES